MKKLLITAIALLCASSFVVNAQDEKPGNRGALRAEKKALKKEMLEKYDANKDGKLNKEERAKMKEDAKISKEDKDKMSEAGLGKNKKAKGEKKTK